MLTLLYFGVQVYFTRTWNFTWRLSDCEEIRGGNLFPGKGIKELKELVDSGKFVSVLCR